MTKWPVLILALLFFGTASVADAREVELKIHSITVAPFAVDDDFWNDDFEIDIELASCIFNDVKLGYNCSTYLEVAEITVPGNLTNRDVVHKLDLSYRFDLEELTPEEKRSRPEIVAVETGLPYELVGTGAAACLWEILFDESKSCGAFSINNEDLRIRAELNPL